MATTLSFALAHVSFFCALVVKPSPYRPLLMVPILLSVWHFYQTALNCRTPVEYTMGCVMAALPFIASSYILLTDIQRELFTKGQEKPAYLLPLVERIKWAIKLNLSARAIGWSHEAKYALPPAPPPSITRFQFVVQEIRHLVFGVVLCDAYITYSKINPSFSASGSSIAADGLFWRAVNVLATGFGGSIMMSISYRVPTIILVSCGIWEPEDCPPLFGDFSYAYTLRNFWGRSWHQTLRWASVSHGHFIAHKLLRLQRGSWAAYQIQLWTAFTITALIHVGGEYTMLGYFTTRHAIRFFLLQPVGVTVEALVIACGKKLSIPGWRLLGYLWVVAWFTYTVPEWIDPMFRRGLVDMIPTIGIVSRFWSI